jgi:hypothetical protein
LPGSFGSDRYWIGPLPAAAAADEPGYINVVDDHQTLLCVRDAEIERSGLLRL